MHAIIKRLLGRQEARKVSDADRYRQLLHQIDRRYADQQAKGKIDGDAKPELTEAETTELETVMKSTGYTVENLAEHLKAIGDYRIALALQADRDRHAAELERHTAIALEFEAGRRAAIEKLDAEWNKALRPRDEAKAKVDALDQKLTYQYNIGHLVDAHHQILGLPDPSENAKTMHIIHYGKAPATEFHCMLFREFIRNPAGHLLHDANGGVTKSPLDGKTIIPAPGQSQRECDELAELTRFAIEQEINKLFPGWLTEETAASWKHITYLAESEEYGESGRNFLIFGDEMKSMGEPHRPTFNPHKWIAVDPPGQPRGVAAKLLAKLSSSYDRHPVIAREREAAGLPPVRLETEPAPARNPEHAFALTGQS